MRMFLQCKTGAGNYFKTCFRFDFGLDARFGACVSCIYSLNNDSCVSYIPVEQFKQGFVKFDTKAFRG